MEAEDSPKVTGLDTETDFPSTVYELDIGTDAPPGASRLDTETGTSTGATALDETPGNVVFDESPIAQNGITSAGSHFQTPTPTKHQPYKQPTPEETTIQHNDTKPNSEETMDLIQTWLQAGYSMHCCDQIPKSRCNDRCLPGYRKAFNGGFHVCCYDCVQCSEGEFCNTTDCEICYRCPDEEWPDERRVRCVPKIYDFLSYEKDIVVQISAVTASLFSAITLFILGNFIYYWNTPIVKANNRAVSFILLISILLSFLCVFLFLGRPVDITCRLRQMSFGIFFSTAVSSVLAKTVTVFIAFKATKPGSTWRKWVTLKVSNYVVIVCSSVQALICGIWLTVSSPYQEYDHHSYKGMIIVQCNEGSVIWLYSMLGYMGILASVNFVLAFMVRTLPDSFNEAKFITFSMLVLCSVWIAMIPAYLSTKGKYMVAVEIFAILTSCAGVLGCIFFPKLYILLIKPEFNSRKTILGKNTI
ncbi:vomeronasal type-2 receptor 26-like [Pseudophryne corroboree]|uniref:vomeronasal type-2 receptor 26-like n=1 Tax=Pseudophryne corroboree TaxID=495146 RepID=UPI0030821075